jgi:ABC-type dipeptide/oligopeptide/nickel transport system permease component
MSQLTRLLSQATQGLLTVLVLVLAVFFVIRLLPGDPARAVAGELATVEDVERIRQEMGLDQPLHVQAVRYLQRLAVGDLGKSLRTYQPVWVEIQQRIGRTLVLSGTALFLSLIIGLALAVVAARRPGSLADSAVNITAILAYGTPVFWVALVAIDLFAVRWRLLPSGGQDTARHLILPALVLSFFLMGPIAQITRSSLAEILNRDYIWMARAKGVGEWRVLAVHALRNALLPTLAYMGTQAGLLFGGAAITETIFTWNGLGQLAVTAALSRDYPLLQGLLLTIGIGFVLINLSLEFIYGVVDPRIRLKA